MKGSNPGGGVAQSGSSNNGDVGCGGPTIKIKLSHGSNHHDLTVPSHSTFGDLKRVIAQETGLGPKEQILLFRGNEKEDEEYLHVAGLKDNSKLLLMENSANNDVKLEEVKESSGLSRGYEAVAEVRAEDDKLAEQVAALNAVVCGGTKVAEKDIIFLTEMLERQLLKLDGIEAEGEGRVQRKMEVRRVQSLVETVDDLKAKNSAPNTGSSNDMLVTPSDARNLDAPPATKVTQDWEVFE